MIVDDIEQAEKDLQAAAKKLAELRSKAVYVCPLCSGEMHYYKGHFNDSGGEYPPSVKCSCGFKFSRDLSNFQGQGRKGNSGWDIAEAQMREAEHEIAHRFMRTK